MRGKVVNFCMALLNLLIGISILVYVLKIPREITELTVQEYNIVNVIKIIIYIGLVLGSVFNILQYFAQRSRWNEKNGLLISNF